MLLSIGAALDQSHRLEGGVFELRFHITDDLIFSALDKDHKSCFLSRFDILLSK